jgi:4-hydroxy-3-polyprenylbenzoate decarboxylase
MSYRNLREHIDKLEQEGELQRIKVEVDWDVELSAIMRQVFKQNGPACLFENVKGYKTPVFSGALFGHKKYAMNIDAPPNLKGILEKVKSAMANPIDIKMVGSGHCKENIDKGNKIDLGKFPVPRWHELDGGRYIGTLGVVITKDPETGIRNLAVYREQLLGKDKTALNPEQQGGIHLRKYRAMNKPMPVVTCIGVPPSVLCAALTKAPYGQDESGIAGALCGEPVPFIKCETVDLEVPADTEIVIEGEVPPDTSKWELEGPFGEFTGHFHTLEKGQKPTIYVSAVTYRDNPIYQGCSPGIAPNEETTPREIGGTAGAWTELQQSGIPGIKDVYVTEMGCAGFTTIVQMDRHFYLGNVRQIIYFCFAKLFMCKWVIVVDDDVDIYDKGAIEWVLATRVQPHRDIIITDNRLQGVELDPSIHSDLAKIPRAQTSKIGIDATTKFKGHDFAPLVLDSAEMQKKIESRWKEYGFKF